MNVDFLTRFQQQETDEEISFPENSCLGRRPHADPTKKSNTMEKKTENNLLTTVSPYAGGTDSRHELRGYGNLLLHIPHSSTAIPRNSDCPAAFDLEEWKLIDLYTDTLFAGKIADRRIEPIVFRRCRLYCDVERLPDDPLERQGLGISYERRAADGRLRRWGDRHQALREYARYHYQTTLKILNKIQSSSGALLMIDCHSFSSQPNLLNPQPPQDIDVCLGYNDDETRPSDAVVSLMQRYFVSKGYRVALNTPFSNSKTFDVPGGNRYHSVMIEVNKRLYMNEQTRKPTAHFSQLQHTLRALYAALLQQQE